MGCNHFKNTPLHYYTSAQRKLGYKMDHRLTMIGMGINLFLVAVTMVVFARGILQLSGIITKKRLLRGLWYFEIVFGLALVTIGLFGGVLSFILDTPSWTFIVVIMTVFILAFVHLAFCDIRKTFVILEMRNIESEQKSLDELFKTYRKKNV